MTSRRSLFATLVHPPAASAVPAAPAMTCRPDAHGEPVSLFGFGAMRLPTVDGSHANQWGGGSKAAIDDAAVARLLDAGIEGGLSYFDTAPVYCRGESERALGKALARHPRAKWHVATKLSNMNAKLWSADAAKKMYANSFEALRTDRLDFYLLHSLGGGGDKAMQVFEDRVIRNGLLDFLMAERNAGRIRNLGFSFHGSLAVFKRVLEMHDRVHWDFAQIQLNYVDWRHARAKNPNAINAETLYSLLDERGISVVAMSPLLGGRLARPCGALNAKLVPAAPGDSFTKWAFRFCGSLPRVMTVLSGLTFVEHMREDVSIFSPLKPLSKAEFALLEEAAAAFVGERTIPCTSCDYCMPCPYGLDIPGLLNFHNARQFDAAADFLAAYDRQFPKLRRADHCTGCARCNAHCPQSIDIAAEVRRIDARVEGLRRARRKR